MPPILLVVLSLAVFAFLVGMLSAETAWLRAFSFFGIGWCGGKWLSRHLGRGRILIRRGGNPSSSIGVEPGLWTFISWSTLGVGMFVVISALDDYDAGIIAMKGFGVGIVFAGVHAMRPKGPQGSHDA
jgi:hypothetical protein